MRPTSVLRDIFVSFLKLLIKLFRVPVHLNIFSILLK